MHSFCSFVRFSELSVKIKMVSHMCPKKIILSYLFMDCLRTKCLYALNIDFFLSLIYFFMVLRGIDKYHGWQGRDSVIH